MSQPLLIRVLLAVVTLLTFGNLLSADFTSWDDPTTTAANPHLNPPTLAGLAHHWRHGDYGLYIPVTYTGWWLIAQVAQLHEADPRGVTLNPAIFHLANVLLHCANAVLVFEILRKLLKRNWPAAAGALVFALHPMQVEAVGWVSGMKDVLSGTFSLLAVLSYLIYASMTTEDTSARVRRKFYLLGIICFVAGILSKPSAMVVPGIALAIDYFCLQRPLRVIAQSLWPWFVITLVAAISAKQFQPAIGIVSVPIWARPFIVSDSLSFYLYKLLLPIKLGIDYGRRPQVVMQQPWFYFAWLIPAVIAFLLVRGRRSRPMLLAAGCVFVIAVSPTLGWTRFLFQYYSTVADHYLYVAILGPALAIAWGMTRVRAKSMYYLCGVLLAGYAVLSALQTGSWKSDQTLFRHTIETNPKSFLGYNNLGHMYHMLASQASDPRERSELLTLAARAFHNSIESNPDYPDAHQNMALVLILHGDVDPAIEQIKESLRLYAQQPREIRLEFYRGYLNLARLLVQRYRPAEAVQAYQEYLKYAPNDSEAKDELNSVMSDLQRSEKGTTKATQRAP